MARNSEIFLGGKNSTVIYLGEEEHKIYLGSKLVYQPKISITSATVSVGSKTYNGSNQTASSITVTLSGKTLTVGEDYQITSNSGGTNVGNYTVTVTGIGLYKDTASGTFTINKVTPTVTAPTPKVLTYNGSAQVLATAGSTNFGTLKYSLDNSSWQTAVPAATNQGSYTVYYKVDGNSNVNSVASKNITCSINAKQVTATVTLSQSTYTYSGSACKPTVTVKDGSTVIDPSEYTVTYSNNVNAGTATVTISDNVGGNYEVIGSANFTINKAAGSISYATTTVNKTYGNSAFTNALTKTGDGSVTYSSSNTSIATVSSSGQVTIKGAGSATITATVTDGTNYTYATKTASYTLSVAKATPTVTAPTAKDLTYSGGAQTLINAGSTTGGTIQYKFGSGTYGTALPSATAKGSYTVYYKVVGNSNYNDVAEASITVNIKAKALTITAKAQTVPYGTAITQGTSQVTVSGLVSGDSLTAITLTQSTVNVTTTGTITPSAAATTNGIGNYSVTYTNGNLTITAVEPVKTDPVKIGSITYNGSAQNLITAGSSSHGTFTYKLSSASTYGSSIPTGTNAGTYSVDWKFVADANHGGGTVTGTITGITIGQKSLTIAAKSQSVVYGTAITQGTSQVTVSGLVSGDSLTAITLTQSTVNVTTTGTITPSAAATTNGIGNYSVTYDTGTLTITQKALTITAKAQTVNYGTAITQGVDQVTTSGLVSGDALTAITLTQSTVNVTTTGTITPSAAATTNGIGNYSVTYNTGNLTINKVAASVTKAPTAKSLTYNTEAQALVNAGTANGGTMYYQMTTSNSKPSNTSGFSSTIPTGTNAGTYYVWYYVKGDSNHNDTAINGTAVSVTIANKTIVIPTPTNASKVYDGTAASATFGAATGATITKYRYSTDNSSWTETSSNPTQTNYGTLYTQAYYTASANYTGSGWSSSATISIAKAAPTYTAPTAKSLTYNGSAQALLNAGSTSHGTIQYSSDNSTWSTTIPTGTNVNTYTSYWRLVGDKNHTDVASKSLSTTISKVTPTVTAPTAKSLTFNGSAQTLANAGSTNFGTLQYSPDNTNWSTTIPTGTNATSYTVYYRVVGNSNINDVASANITCSISKATLTITAKEQSIQWGNSIATGTGQVTTSGLVSGDSLTGITLTPSTSDLTTTGTITPSAASTSKGASNYTITYNTGKLTITQRVITITAKAQSVTYGTAITTGTGQVTISGSGLASSNSLTSISLAASRSTVGSGTITPSAAVIKNGTTDVTSKYSITYNTGTLTITAKALTVTAKNQSISFGDSIATGTGQVTVSGLISGDSLTGVTLTASTTAVTTTGTITPSAATTTNGAGNYSITYNTGTLTISKRAITVTAKAQTVNYGTAISQGTAYVTTSSLGRLSLTGITLTQSTTNVPGGTITPSAAVIKDGTTDVTSSCTLTYNTGTLTINKVAATKTNPTKVTLTYNGAAQNLANAGTSSHGTFTYKLSSASSYGTAIPQATNVGSSYAVDWQFTPDGNHTGADSGSFTSTISAKALTITAKGQSISFGDSIATGTGQVTVSGLVSGDSLTAITLTASTTAVTTSGTITPSAATTTKGASNYSITYNTGALTISKRAITITAKAQTVTFGTAITTGTGQVTTSSLGRLTLSSITLTPSTTNVTTTGTITPSAAVIKDGTTDVTSSCTLTYNTGTLTINKKALTITAKAQTITYGNSIATGTGQVTTSGLISGDSLTAVTLTASTTDVPGGTITPSAATCTKGISNYSVTYNTGTLTINKANPTYTAPAATNPTYNGSAQYLITTGSTSHGTIKYSSDGSTWGTTRPTGTNATSYDVYWKLDGDSNHNSVASTKVTSTIGKVTPTVTAPTAKVLTYNGSAQVLANAGSTNFGTLKYSLDNSTWSTTVPSATNQGSYTLYYKVDGDSNINNVASKNIACSISAKSITATVTLSQSTYTYSGSACKPTVTVKDGSTVIPASEYTVTYSNNVNVGTATVTITDNEGGNYTVIGSATFTITKANPTYTAPTAKNLTYNKTAQALLNAGSTSHGTIYYSSDNSTWNTTIPTGTNAGSYDVYWKLDGDSNHNNVNSTKITVTIAQREVTLTWGTTSWTYDKTAHSTTCTAGNVVSGDTCTVTMTGNSITNVGSTTVTASSLSNSNYKLPSANTKSISVTQREVTLTWGTVTWTYDAAAHGTTCTAGNLCSGDTCTVTLTGNSITNAGTATVTASSLSNSNYKLPSSKTATLTVNAKAVTYTATNESWTYDKSAHSAANTATITAGGLVSGHSATITCTGSITNAGTATKTLSSVVIKNSGGTDVSANYSITKKNGTLTVNAKEVTLSWGTLTWTYDGSAHSTTCTAGSLISGDTCTVTLTGNSITNKGTATVTASSLSNSNYKLPSAKTATLTINAKTVTLNWGTTSWTYDKASHSTTCTASGLVGSDTCTVTLTGNSVGPNVGSATVTASALSNSNYALPSSKTKTISVTARTVTLTWGTVSWVYDAAAHSTTCTAGNVVSGDTCTVTLTGNSITNKGTTNVTASSLSNSNYALPSAKTATLTITARPINVTAGSTSKTYDGTALTYNSATAESTGTNRGLVSGHSMTACTVTGTITNAGSANNVPSAATIKSGSTDVTSNYSITYVNGTLTVNKYTPTVTLSATNRAYNGSALYATATVSKPTSGTTIKGTIYYGTSSGATTYNVTYSGSGSVNLSSVSVTNVGSATVYAYFVPDSSCNGVYNNSGNVSKTFSVTQANGSGTVTMSGWVYGNSVTNPSVSSSTNPTTGVTYTWYNSSKTALSAKPTSTSSVGTYYVKATFPANTNYKSYTTDYVSFSITQREVTLTWGTTSWTYDKATHSTTCTAGNVVSGDTCTVTLSGNSVGTNVGSATVTASSLSNSNYKLPSSKTKTISITQREVTLTWGTASWTYDKTEHSTTCTAGNLCSGDTCYVTLTGNSITNVGTTTVTASSLGNSNYKLPSSNTKTLTVNAREVTLTWGTASWTYDKSAHSTTCTLGNIVSGDSCTVTLTGNSITNVGSTTVTASSLSNSNYKLPSSNTKSISVTARTVTLTWGTVTWTYDAAAHSTTCTAGNVVSGDTCTVTLSGNSITNKGTTTVTASSLSNSNYALPSSKTNTLTISARPINVTAGSTSKTYDGTALTYNSATAESTGTNRGLVSGHSMTSCTVTGTITTKGSVNNTPSAAVIKSGTTDVTSNYNINYVNGTLTINARAVTSTAANESWTYNGSAHNASNTGITINLPSGHTATYSCSGSITNAGTATKTLNSVTIKNSGGTDVTSSFTITKNNGTLTVTKANITPSVSMNGWVWGETAQSPSVSGNMGSGSVTYTYLYPGTSSYSSTAPVSKSDIGSYTVKASIAESTNYNSGTATNTFSIITNFKPSGSDALITSNSQYFEVST